MFFSLRRSSRKSSVTNIVAWRGPCGPWPWRTGAPALQARGRTFARANFCTAAGNIWPLRLASDRIRERQTHTKFHRTGSLRLDGYRTVRVRPFILHDIGTGVQAFHVKSSLLTLMFTWTRKRESLEFWNLRPNSGIKLHWIKIRILIESLWEKKRGSCFWEKKWGKAACVQRLLISWYVIFLIQKQSENENKTKTKDRTTRS